jgi:hypothetical protein
MQGRRQLCAREQLPVLCSLPVAMQTTLQRARGKPSCNLRRRCGGNPCGGNIRSHKGSVSLERRKRVRAVDGGAGAGSGELGRAATAILAWDLDNMQLRGPTDHAHATLQLLRQVAMALQELGGDPPRWVRLAYANGDTLAQPWMSTEGAALLMQYGWQLREVATEAQAADQALHAEVRAALQYENVAMLMLLSADVGFAPLVTAARHQGVRHPSNVALSEAGRFCWTRLPSQLDVNLSLRCARSCCVTGAHGGDAASTRVCGAGDQVANRQSAVGACGGRMRGAAPTVRPGGGRCVAGWR